jgi:hypothetical protein
VERKKMKKKIRMFIFIIPIFCMITACKPIFSPILRVVPALQLNIQKKKNEKKIEIYRIEVLVRSSTWHAQYYLLTVKNNIIIDSTSRCVVAPTENGKCLVNPYNAEDYSIPGIFAKASSAIESNDIQWIEIGYDPTYGFPKIISFLNPSVMDSDWLWGVTSFEELNQ